MTTQRSTGDWREGPARWRARRSEGRVELQRVDPAARSRLFLYAIIFGCSFWAFWDGLGLVIGVVAAIGVPILMFSRMRAATVADVLRGARSIAWVALPAPNGSYRKSARLPDQLEVDGMKVELEAAELMKVHRIHRTGSHLHRTHHVWLRVGDRLFELCEEPVPEQADRVYAFVREHLPSIRVKGGSRADSLPNDRRAIGLTVVVALLMWTLTFAAPLLLLDAPQRWYAWLLFALGLVLLGIDELHRLALARIGRRTLVRSLRRRYRLDR